MSGKRLYAACWIRITARKPVIWRRRSSRLDVSWRWKTMHWPRRSERPTSHLHRRCVLRQDPRRRSDQEVAVHLRRPAPVAVAVVPAVDFEGSPWHVNYRKALELVAPIE